jgi:hypothetical protein
VTFRHAAAQSRNENSKALTMATALPLLSTEHPRLFIMKLAAGMFNSV